MRLRKIIQDVRNDVLVSVARVWEIAIKSSLGKLSLPHPVVPVLQRQLINHELVLLTLQLAHLATLEKLPHHHRDPFDRLLIAQCIEEGAALITVDPQLRRYPVEIFD